MFAFFRNLEPAQRRLMLTCYFSFFASGLLTLMVGSVMPDLRASAGLSDTAGGLLISSYSLGNLAAAFVAGILPLYLGRKRSLLLTLALGVLGIGLTGGSAAGFLYLAFPLMGLAKGSLVNFDNWAVNRLSLGDAGAANLLHACFAVGAILAPLIFLLLSRLISWQAAMLFVGACFLLTLFLFTRVQVPDNRPDRHQSQVRTLRFLRDRHFQVLCLMMFCYLCSEYSVNGWLVTYIQSKESLMAAFQEPGSLSAFSQTMAALLWSVMLLGRLIMARLSTQFNQKKLLAAGALGMTLGFAGMLCASSVPFVILFIALMGLSMAGLSPMITADAAVFTNAYPLAMGTLLAIASLGGVLMPSMVGILAERAGFQGGMAVILGMILLLLLSSILNLRMSGTERKRGISG